MLGALVLNGVGGEVDGIDVVTVDEWPATGGCAAPQAADKANTPLPRCWPQRGTPLTVLERETTFCRFEDQGTRLSPRNTA
jgi:hypothetical protein